MNLEGMRAVVIDDVYEDVKKLFLALNKKGIPYSYYSNIKDLPLCPQEGIRLVFLDFNLNASGDTDPKTKESVIESFLSKIISQDNGPYILIVWATSFENEEVLKLLKERLPKFQKSLPVLIINDFKKDDLKDNANEIIKKLGEKIKLSKIVNILFQWEKFGHEALNETLKKFIGENLDEKNLDIFLEKVDYKIKNDFYNLCVSEFGKDNVKKNISIIKTPQFLLNEFFKENSDKRILDFKNYEESLIEEVFNKNKKYTLLEKAKKNTFFHLDLKKNSQLSPGSFYSIKLSRHETAPIPYNLDANSDGISKHFKHFEITSLKNNLFDAYIDCDKDGEKKKLKEQLIDKCTPILFEISPECDYSQNKMKSAKFIIGLIVPEEMPIKKKALHLYKSPAIIYTGKDIYRIVMHSNYIVNIKLNKIKDKEKLFVARKPFFTHIQHWFASHTSRPGKIEFN